MGGAVGSLLVRYWLDLPLWKKAIAVGVLWAAAVVVAWLA